jgi:hypothetical protein
MADRDAQGDSPSGRQAILLIFLLSGFAGLVYEVVWARQLVLVFRNTTQAISAILTGFFGGMAIGSLLGGRIADRVRSPLSMYAVLELILVVTVVLTRGRSAAYTSSIVQPSRRCSRTPPRSPSSDSRTACATVSYPGRYVANVIGPGRLPNARLDSNEHRRRLPVGVDEDSVGS